jgi:hypothetical protein
MQLTQTPLERRLYVFEGVGTLRLTGWMLNGATAEARGLSWQISSRGIRQRVIQASDATGAVVGRFNGRTLHGGQALRWSTRELVLRPESVWRERYVLVDESRRVATIERKGWDARAVDMTVDDAAAAEPELLLFAAFVVGTLAQHAQPARGGRGTRRMRSRRRRG